MTDQEIIVAVAKLDNWVFALINSFSERVFHGSGPRIGQVASIEGDNGKGKFPDYLNSRDAIVPVIEKHLNSRPGYYNRSFIHALQDVLGQDGDAGIDKRQACALLLATPLQLCMALLEDAKSEL